MVRPRKKEVGNVITVTMSPDTRTKLKAIADEEKRSMSEIVTYLITKESELREGGQGALRILNLLEDALLILTRFGSMPMPQFKELHGLLDKIRKELPEYQKQSGKK